MNDQRRPRMSAITAALRRLDDVAAEGDLTPDPLLSDSLEFEAPNDLIVLPDGKRIYPPTLHGERVDALALALLDTNDPARSAFLRLIGPPGAGKSQIARAIAYRLWTERGRAVQDRRGAPFYGFVELQPGRARTSSSSATSGCRSPAPAGRSRWWTRPSCRPCA